MIIHQWCYIIDKASDNLLHFRKNLSEIMQKLIMTTDGKIKDENPKYDINRQAAKISPLSSGKFDKYDHLTGKQILSSDQSKIKGQAEFTFSRLSKAFEKHIKTIKYRGGKQIKGPEEHGKQLVKCSNGKKVFNTFKTKRNFWTTC